MNEIKKKTAEYREERILKRRKTAKSKYKKLTGLKEALQRHGKDPKEVTNKMMRKMKSKPRFMKKILGIGDDSTMDMEKSTGGMDEELDQGELLKRRAKSRIRDMKRSRTLGETEEPSEIEKVVIFFKLEIRKIEKKI